MAVSKASPRRVRKPATPKPEPKNKGGRPRIGFDGTDKEAVKLLAMVGTKHSIIAGIIRCSEDTLGRRFREELDFGKAHSEALVGATLFQKALEGDIGAIVWFEKTRMGMKDTSRHEHSGVDGKPIELKDMSRYTDEELDAIERASNILAGTTPGGAAEPE